MRVLLCTLFVAVATPAHGATDDAWWRAAAPCPPATKLRGEPPPRGADVGCAKASGAWHGRRTVWFDACTPAAPCAAAKAKKRFEGEYNRGIEHGHWTFWRQDGEKALEGEYFAGKRSGTWRTWDKDGKAGAIENPVLTGTKTPVEVAILEALQAATASGKTDLAAELEEASRDLKRGGTAAARDDTSRGDKTGEAIASGVHLGASGQDIPDLDLGATRFAEGDEAASPYVQEAARLATQEVGRCYRQARAARPDLAGDLVARYGIAPDGRLVDVLVVQSTLTEAFNQCVKRALQERVRLPPHAGPAPIEVISPWRLVAPGREPNKR